MDTEELIRENAELRRRLMHAERWMRREVGSARMNRKKEEITQHARSYFHNIFEETGLDIIGKLIDNRFPAGFHHAPPHTRERLMDAEIYWYTLQKYPTLDALPIILSYQKILDAWIEHVMVRPWRDVIGSQQIESGVLHPSLEHHLVLVRREGYTLSIGRWYQILEILGNEENTDGMVGHIAAFWKEYIPVSAILIQESFFRPLSELIRREVFSKKRHTKKVNFSDAKRTRELCIGSGGILVQIL